MKQIIFYLALLFFYSCNSHSVTYYRYQNVIVTRIDKDDKSAFYYGLVSDTAKESDAAIIGSYPRGNDQMTGYLEFCNNGSINFIKTEGKFYVPKRHPLFNPIEYKYDNFLKWEKFAESNFSNITIIDRERAIEIKVDSIYKSKVIIEHIN